MTKVAIIYYSSTGNAYQLVKAAEEGARAAGAETRVRKVRELAPDEAIATNAGWQQHVRSTESVPHATLEDLEWADGYIFATPTRYGNISAQLKQFLDASGPLWAQGKLANKAVAGIAGAGNAHGGQETTLLALYNSMYHWGAVVVAPGYTDSLLYAAGGNPYGVSYTDAQGAQQPPEVLAAARYLGGRVASFAAVLSENRDRLVPTQQEAAAGAVSAGGTA
ncbi:MAG: NAD(P)H-dependent oxidoreductase [Chloroflexota bacterium]